MTPPWSVHRIRPAVVAAIGVVLALTLGSYYARRRARPPKLPPPRAMAADVGQQTRGFALSKTVGDQTLYTIQAEQVTNYEDTGKALLRGVTVVMFGKDGSRHDTITSPECIYDPASSVVWIPGDVEMQFDLPKGEQDDGRAQSRASVSIFTSRLTFDQASGGATTDAPVRMLFAEGQGTSQGAFYDPRKQELLLKRDVRFSLTSADAAGPIREAAPTTVRADSAQLFREQGRLVLNGDVELARGARRVRGSQAELDLAPSFTVRQARLHGDVTAFDETASDALNAQAQEAVVDFNDAGRVQTIALAGGVAWQMRSLDRQGQKDGAAQNVRLFFEPEAGPDARLDRILAEGNVRMRFQSAPSGASAAPGPGLSEAQTISGDSAEMTMAASGKTLDRTRVRGTPRLQLDASRSGADARTVTANEFLITMDERGELSGFRAEGDVHFVSSPASGSPDAPQARRESSSDFLEASFDGSAPDGGPPNGGTRGTLHRLRQWGHFAYRDAERQARAEQASSVIGEQTIVLEGAPSVWNADGKLSAARITLETGTGVMRAENGVSSTFFEKPSAARPRPEPVHAVSDRLRYDPRGKTSHLEGHARLWQGEAFLLESDALDWSAAAGELTAAGKVYSVFREPSQGAPRPAASSSASAERGGMVITAASFRYQSAKRLAHYQGGVRMTRDTGTMTAAEMDVILKAAASDAAGLPLGAGQIERAEARRDVRISSGARTASGDRGEYLPASNQVRLFGSLAKATDPARGTVQGAELTYHLGDDRIQVQGSPGSPTETRWQVHP